MRQAAYSGCRDADACARSSAHLPAAHPRGRAERPRDGRDAHLHRVRPAQPRARGARTSATAASRPGTARATGRRRPARTRSARPSTASTPTPACGSRYHRLRCGDWWDEDPRSPTYNRFQHLACGATPPFHGGQRGALAGDRRLPGVRRRAVQRRAGRARAGAAGSSCTTTPATPRTAASRCRGRSCSAAAPAPARGDDLDQYCIIFSLPV